MSESFKIKTPVFEGPLDLLLSLIEKKKLFINDISLSKVTDDFISYIQTFNTMPMNDSAQFILIASTLLLIKSRSLLPSLTLTEEEEQGIEDLETRLKIYKRIKDASLNINNIFGKNIMFDQNQSRSLDIVFSPHEKIKVDNLLSYIKDIIKLLPKAESIPKAVVKKVISLEDTINNLANKINQGLKMKFSDFSSIGKEDKVNVIVSFLAMLELVKQGIINVSQDKNYGDIQMESKEIGVPRYT